MKTKEYLVQFEKLTERPETKVMKAMSKIEIKKQIGPVRWIKITRL